MMRLTMAVWWSLAIIWLLTSQVDAEPAPAAARRVEVIGYGPTIDAAKRDALDEAALKLRALLREQHLEHWKPARDVVRKFLQNGAPGKEETIDGLGDVKSWRVALEIPDEESLRRFDRQALRAERSEERIRLAVPIMLALGLALAVLIGCIRVDEWTHSRYTWSIWALAAALLSALGVGWWYLLST